MSTAAEAEAARPITLDAFEVWRCSRYGTPYLGSDFTARVLYELDGVAWTSGLQSDRKGRGESINVEVTAEANVLGQQLALVQVRQCRFRPGRFNRVRKDYYLTGRNENGNAFAHPVTATARTTVRQALARVWGCDPRDLDDVRRNGDVAFVPVRGVLPDGLDPVEESVLLAGSHRLSGDVFRDRNGVLYVRGNAKITHAKHQHPTARTRGGWWRVQVAERAAGWGFSAPTAD